MVAAAKDMLSAFSILSPLEYSEAAPHDSESFNLAEMLGAASTEEHLVQQPQSEAGNAAVWADCLDLVGEHGRTAFSADMDASLIKKVSKLPEIFAEQACKRRCDVKQAHGL